MVPVWSSRTNRVVMRYPDRQKNTVTPTKPSMSGLVGACWPRTRRIATARTPSIQDGSPGRARADLSKAGAIGGSNTLDSRTYRRGSSDDLLRGGTCVSGQGILAWPVASAVRGYRSSPRDINPFDFAQVAMVGLPRSLILETCVQHRRPRREHGASCACATKVAPSSATAGISTAIRTSSSHLLARTLRSRDSCTVTDPIPDNVPAASIVRPFTYREGGRDACRCKTGAGSGSTWTGEAPSTRRHRRVHDDERVADWRNCCVTRPAGMAYRGFDRGPPQRWHGHAGLYRAGRGHHRCNGDAADPVQRRIAHEAHGRHGESRGWPAPGSCQPDDTVATHVPVSARCALGPPRSAAGPARQPVPEIP